MMTCWAEVRRSLPASLIAVLALTMGCDETIVLGQRPGGVGGVGAVPGAGGSAPTSPGSGGGAGDSTLPPLGGDPNPPDPPAVILWSTDHEGDDGLAPWDTGSWAEGRPYRWGSGASELSTEQAVSGSQSVRCSIDTDQPNNGGTSHGVRLYRRIADEPAYYSAWFWLENAHEVEDWWSIFLFNALPSPETIDNTVDLLGQTIDLLDVRLELQDSELLLSFYDHFNERSLQASGTTVPVQQWFHLETYFEYAPPETVRARLWLDGQLLLELDGLGQPETDNLYWVIGNGSSALVPSESVLYIDDAAIATYRVGP